MIQIFFFILLTSSCLYDCTQCEPGYTLIDKMCISTTHKYDPDNNFNCNDAICVFDYTKSSKQTIELSTYLSTLALSQNKTTIRMNSGKIHSIITGKEIVFANATEIVKLDLKDASITSQNKLKSNYINCNTISLENDGEIQQITTNIFQMNYANIRTHKINQFNINGNVTIRIVVNDVQKEEIEKQGIYLFHGTKFVFGNKTQNTNTTNEKFTTDNVKLELVENGKIISVGNVKFYTDLCRSKRMAAFLKEAPKDKDVSCPDYIFVEPTTKAWWISAVVLLCLIAIVIILAIVYLIIKKIRTRKQQLGSEF